MKAILAAAMMMVAIVSMAEDRFYPGTKPYWWDLPMQCETAGNFEVCSAGAWDLGIVTSGAANEVALFAKVIRGGGDEALLFHVSPRAGKKEPSFVCGDGTTVMKVENLGASGHGQSRWFRYLADSKTSLSHCIKRELRMVMEGKTYRLGTKLLREALVNVRER